MLEGVELAFIVVAVGAGGAESLWPASIGALAVMLRVVPIGLALHGPLARVPEHSLNFVVGVLR